MILSDADGNVIDVFETGALRAGTTSGRVVGSGAPGARLFCFCNKGKSNDAAVRSAYAAEPVFSETALYHDAAFPLVLTSATEGAEIRYTLDGSAPGPDSTLYTSPINISSNAVVRAAAYCDGLLQSDSVVMTYLFEQPHTVPVICISISPSAFSEVYAATIKKERVERQGVFSFYEDGALGVSFPCGFRASGASTLTAAQKSLAVLLRSGYGVAETNYPFFANSDVSAYRSLVLRNSGQDRTAARIRDSFFMKAVKGLNIEQVETRLTVVYVNGKYWGIYDLNENQNEDYLASHYGVDPDAVDVIRRNFTALEGTKYDFLRVREYALNGTFPTMRCLPSSQNGSTLRILQIISLPRPTLPTAICSIKNTGAHRIIPLNGALCFLTLISACIRQAQPGTFFLHIFGWKVSLLRMVP